MAKSRAVEPSGCIVFLLLLLASPVSAMNLYVDRLDDEYNGCSMESCSLREAITVANGSDVYDTIILPAGTVELSRVGAGEDGNSTGDLDITRSVTIVGKGPGVSIVDANYLDRVFHIMGSGVVGAFEGMTITRGGNLAMGDCGGGIYVSHGTAVILRCDVVDNVSPLGGITSGCGGGIQARTGAVLWIEDSSVRSNVADNLGGGMFVNNESSLHVLRSTISQNHASVGAPAVYFQGDTGQINDSTISGNFTGSLDYGSIFVSGSMTLGFCTLTGNTDPTIKSSAANSVTLGRTIIHGQCGDSGISLGGNIETPGNTCGLSPLNDLMTSVDPDLGPLGLFGGLTETHRPSPTSVVVDLIFPPGVPDCTRPDQRGVPRPADSSGGATPLCDVGAVELIHGEIFLDGFECGYTGSWSSEAP